MKMNIPLDIDIFIAIKCRHFALNLWGVRKEIFQIPRVFKRILYKSFPHIKTSTDKLSPEETQDLSVPERN